MVWWVGYQQQLLIFVHLKNHICITELETNHHAFACIRHTLGQGVCVGAHIAVEPCWGCHAGRHAAGQARGLAVQILEPSGAAPAGLLLNHGVRHSNEFPLHSA